ncbi:hypothetical protein AG4045_020644, partial [Apium graveolens]
FNLSTIVQDNTDGLQIIIKDQEIRILIRKRVEDVDSEDNGFPNELKILQGKEYTFKLLIQAKNVEKSNLDYVTIRIIPGL